MHRRAMTAAAPASAAANLLRAISFTVLVLILLTWSRAANGFEPLSEDVLTAEHATPTMQTSIDNDAAPDVGNGAESVTMSIPLDEDGVIDVEAPLMDVKIEKWDGDDVLLIVEKKKTRAKSCGEPLSADAVTIQVTREGKNVRIETAGAYTRRASLSDVSFRIVLPEDDDTAVKLRDQGSTVDQLTAAVWRALRREALRWLTR